MSTLAESRNLDTPLTHRQIAEQLGVSRQLVGFALRGEGRMSDEIRRQILDIAQQNGYDRYSNREARSLAARRYGKRAVTGVLAVVFQSIFEGEPVSTLPYFTPLFGGLETGSINQGVDLVLCPLRTGQLPRLVRENQVDGIICIGTPFETIAQCKDTGLPIVNLLEDADCDLKLLIDNEAGICLSVQHLLDLGHRRIVHLGLSLSVSLERQAIFRREMTAAHVMDESLVLSADCKPSINDGAQLMGEFLKKHGLDAKGKSKKTLPFSALIAFNDLMAMGAMEVLQAAGYRVPEDVSVVGFDDVSTQYNWSPAITSVSFSRSDMGRRAIELLCQRTQPQNGADSETEISPVSEVFPVTFVPRDSTCRFRPHQCGVLT